MRPRCALDEGLGPLRMGEMAADEALGEAGAVRGGPPMP